MPVAPTNPDTLPLADRALVLTAQRLCDPQSEHRLAAWLETEFVCDRRGRRLLPQWKSQGRVRVDLTWLQRWYRTLDHVLPHKAHVETELFARLRDLFTLEAEMVFYDLTSTSFGGAGPAGLAVLGYSGDGKPRNRQVLVGVVMINGWPIVHHVFHGSGARCGSSAKSGRPQKKPRPGLRGRPPRESLGGLGAVAAAEAREAIRQHATGEELAELPLDEFEQAVPVVPNSPLVKDGVEMLTDHAEEHRVLGVAGLIRVLGMRHAPGHRVRARGQMPNEGYSVGNAGWWAGEIGADGFAGEGAPSRLR